MKSNIRHLLVKKLKTFSIKNLFDETMWKKWNETVLFTFLEIKKCLIAQEKKNLCLIFWWVNARKNLLITLWKDFKVSYFFSWSSEKIDVWILSHKTGKTSVKSGTFKYVWSTYFLKFLREKWPEKVAVYCVKWPESQNQNETILDFLRKLFELPYRFILAQLFLVKSDVFANWCVMNGNYVPSALHVVRQGFYHFMAMFF